MEYKSISELHIWDKNPRSINETDFTRLKDQITLLGQYKPLLVMPDGTVLGGNMRLRALQELEIQNIWISSIDFVEEDGLWYAVVNGARQQKGFTSKLSGMTEYALSDNDRAGYYDSGDLANLLSEVDIDEELFAVDFTEPEIISNITDTSPLPEDEAPAVNNDEPAISQLGQVYQLGRHRLMCGDATKIEDVEKLMNGAKVDMVFTDPPYGIDVVKVDGMIGGDRVGRVGTGNIVKTNQYRPVMGDDKPFDPTFLLSLAPKLIIWGGNNFASKLPDNPHWLVWDKKDEVQLDNDFSDCELAWTNIKDRKSVKKYLFKWMGMTREGDRINELTNRVHPTQKPVGLHVNILKDYSEENNIILDLFGGSGSTLIACEQTNRTCLGMELDPRYCDVIRKRYAKFIGSEAEWEAKTPVVS